MPKQSNSERLEQRMALHKAIEKEFGKDCIIVHKPKDVGYYITTSSLPPSRTSKVISELANRMYHTVRLIKK